MFVTWILVGSFQAHNPLGIGKGEWGKGVSYLSVTDKVRESSLAYA